MPEKDMVGIISDTHDHRANIANAVETFNRAGCSLVIHGGDYVAPFTVREFEKLSCPFVGVFGNNDGERRGLTALFSKIGALHDAPHEFTHASKRFAIMHEPVYLDDYKNNSDFDVVVYGHLHEIDIREGKPLVINPGESCSWLSGRSTVVILDLSTMKPELIDLEA